jgi:hypothetical protein
MTRPHETHLIPKDATHLRDRREVLGINPETGDLAVVVARSFSFRTEDGVMVRAVELWAEDALDVLPQPAYTSVARIEQMSLEEQENEAFLIAVEAGKALARERGYTE